MIGLPIFGIFYGYYGYVIIGEFDYVSVISDDESTEESLREWEIHMIRTFIWIIISPTAVLSSAMEHESYKYHDPEWIDLIHTVHRIFINFCYWSPIGLGIYKLINKYRRATNLGNNNKKIEFS